MDETEETLHYDEYGSLFGDITEWITHELAEGAVSFAELVGSIELAKYAAPHTALPPVELDAIMGRIILNAAQTAFSEGNTPRGDALLHEWLMTYSGSSVLPHAE
ncbi:hypothetical protein M1555_01845 [Patescibacteria group bacterium]|nr:hypothetical protein [Patescibacteria group bacterium]